jgi:RHS repeat-associated protein
MTRSIRILSLLALWVLGAAQLRAQVQTGTPPFGSFGGGPDVINLANLNSHISIPVLHKAGRGMNFTYDLSYDSSIWYPVTSGSTTTWTPVNNWGWTGTTPVLTGYATYKALNTSCRYFDSGLGRWFTEYYTQYSNWVYFDPFGISHTMVLGTVQDGGATDCGPPFSSSAHANDGSGLVLSVDGTVSATLYTTVGSKTPLSLGPFKSTVSTDRNGNQISLGTGGVFTDTLNTTALTVTGSGTSSSPIKLTYTAPSGASAFYQINYTNYTVATNFGVSGVSEYRSSPTVPVPLVTSIVLPDNSQYSFTYESTPGTCTPITGTTCTTARIKSITLPTGGVITYTYSGGTNNNGIWSDGSTATLTRVTPDGTWTYAQLKGTGAASTTTVTDPLNNQTVIQFQGIYETQRQAYQGSAGGTLLQTTNTCYNTAPSPCTGTAITLQISQRTVNATIPGPGNLQSQHTDKFDSYGNVTESDDYDFATAAPFPLVRQTLVTYASPGTYLNAFPQSVTVKDGSGTIKSRQDTNYDQSTTFCVTGAPQHDDTGHGCSFTARANATSTVSYTDPANAGGPITKNFTYDSLGNLRSAQLNCCQNKTWSYSSTYRYAYPDSVTSGSSPQLTTSFTYDLNMGLPLTSTDPNNLKTTLTYDNMGRTLTAQVGSLPATNYTYTDSGTWSVMVCSPVQGTNTACQKTLLDGQGRPITSQLLDGSGTVYSATDTQYDSFGRAYKISNPYTGSAAYWTQTYFDALGRVYKTTLPDNSSSLISYADNTGTTTDPAGKQRKAVADGLGRLASIYEPDASNSLTVQTSYAYNVFDQLTQVTQGSQTRSYGYDALGRLFSTVTPEGGQTCFSTRSGSTCNQDGYDSFSNLLTRTDARGVVTSYTYDGLNRVKSVSYNVGSTGVPSPGAVSLTYGTNASQYNNGGLITMTDGVGSENYSYNALEQLTQLQKVIGGQTYNTSYAYNFAGELTQITYPSGRVVQQSMDAIGRLCEIAPSTTGCGTASNPYATGYGYNVASQVTGFKYGNGIYASLGFSPDRLQLNCLDYSTTNRGITCTHDSTTKFGLGYTYGSAGSNNGQIAGITDSVDNGRTVAYTYDPLSRLSTALTSGSTNFPQWGLSWGYDRYGNRTSQTLTAGSGYQGFVQVTASSNQINCIGGSGQSCTGGVVPTYDADGNMTYDGMNTLVYDAENHAVSGSGTLGSGNYTYDGNGLRVQKVSGATTTIYIFSGTKVIAEYDSGAPPAGPTREYVYGGGTLLSRMGSIDVRFTNDSCSGCGGNPVGGGDRNLYINSITAGSTTVLPGDPSVSYITPPCNSDSGGVGALNCNGDMITTATGVESAQTITVNAYGSPDYNIYPHMQLLVGGNIVAQWDVTGTAQNYTITLQSTATQYFSGDHLSNRLVIDSARNTVEQLGHFPFGDPWYNASNDKLYFTTYERDSESGNDYAMARYYTWRIGHFSSPDPIAGSLSNPQSLDRYTYVVDDPNDLTDPSGLYWHDCSWDGSCGIGGGGGGGGAPIYGLIFIKTGDSWDTGQIYGFWKFGVVGYFPTGAGGGGNGSGETADQKKRNCEKGLKLAKENSSAVDRANQMWDTIENAADSHNIDPAMLAAIAVRETGVRNIPQRGGGMGRGIFQIDLGAHPNVTEAQAYNPTFAANYAANLLDSNMNTLAAAHPNLNPAQLLQATAASYNFGTKNISGNPNTIDVGTTGNNYGMNVVLLMDCF